jgi:alpha-glucuronidase
MKLISVTKRFLGLSWLLIAGVSTAHSENGNQMWLRYSMQTDSSRLADYRRTIQHLVVDGDSPALKAATQELTVGLTGILGERVPIGSTAAPNSLIVGDAKSALIRNLVSLGKLRTPGAEGYTIKTVPVIGGAAIVIAAQNDRGVIYGVFHFLRLLQTQMPIKGLDIEQRPANPLRLVDQWDNLDRDRDNDGYPIGSRTGPRNRESPDGDLRNRTI